jgi:hypothetical protein
MVGEMRGEVGWDEEFEGRVWRAKRLEEEQATAEADPLRG